MPDTSTIHQEIVARLSEVRALIEPLQTEADQLAELVAAFADNVPTTPRPPASRALRRSRANPASKAVAPAPATPTAGVKRGRPRGSGNRAQQAIAAITEQPGITAVELAKAMGISPNYLYRVLPRLTQEAKVTKQGKGYHPADAPDKAAAANGHPVLA